MKLAYIFLWTIALIGSVAGFYLIFWNVRQSDLLGSGSILFAIAVAIVPLCLAFSLTKILEYIDKN